MERAEGGRPADVVSGSVGLERLQRLAELWRGCARSAFKDAERYAVGSMERRALEHGAMVYFSCAETLTNLEGPNAVWPRP